MSEAELSQGEHSPVQDPEDPEYELDAEAVNSQRQRVSQSNFRDLVTNNLTKLSRTFDGRSYAYTKLELINKRLFELNPILANNVHLRELNLQQNFLSEFDQALFLKYLTKLNLEGNKIEDIRSLDNEEVLPFLEELNLSGNRIKRLVRIPLKRLRILRINHNEIDQVEFEGSQSLEVLEARNNRITDVSHLSNMPRLKEMYLAENMIEKISTLHDLNSLELLHLRKNKIEIINQKVNLPKLYKLNLRENNVSKLEALEGLSDTLTNLNLLGNPLSEELGDNVRKEIWMIHRHYARINKTDIEPDDKTDFDREYRDRLEEQERLRVEKEAEEREAKEQAEREAAERSAEEKAAREAAEVERFEQEKEKQDEERKAREEEQESNQKKQEGKGDEDDSEEGEESE